MNIPISTQRQLTSAITLANANTLVTEVIRKIVGNDISDSINGSPVTAELVAGVAQNRYKASLENTKA